MDKDISLAAVIPVGWLGGLLLLLLYTLASPFLFIYALFQPEGLNDIPALFGELLGGSGQTGG
jgi:hypothetical protein